MNVKLDISHHEAQAMVIAMGLPKKPNTGIWERKMLEAFKDTQIFGSSFYQMWEDEVEPMRLPDTLGGIDIKDSNLRPKVKRVLKLGREKKALGKGNPFNFNQKDYKQLKQYMETYVKLWVDI